MADFEIELATHGTVGAVDRRYAEEKVARVARLAPRPILFARVTLSEETNPAVERGAVAKATLDVSGRPIRAHVAAHDLRAAIDLLELRLRRQLEDLAEYRQTRRSEAGVAGPGEWRHGDLPTDRPAYFPRPVEERELIRHKTFSDGSESPEEAAFDLRLLDYDFYLFTNALTGEDNVVYRQPDGRPALMQVTPTADPGHGYALDFHLDPAPPPVVEAGDAVERLNAGGEPFVFFVDPGTGRGNVVYRRYDGHYGLITPAVAETSAGSP